MIHKITFVINGHDAVLKRWAVGYLCNALNDLSFDAKIVDLARGGKEQDCEGADVLVVYRCFDYRTTRMARRMKEKGAFVLFFIDDYLFQPNCKYTEGLVVPMEPMENADAIVSCSSVLLSKIPWDKPKILRRSVLDAEAMSVLKQEYRRAGPFSIGWVAGAGRGTGWDMFVSEFLDILNAELKDGEQCVFHSFGQRFLHSRTKVTVKEHMYFHREDWKGLYSELVSFNMGTSINPLDEHDEFCKSKSELKWVETAAMGVPLITSRVPPYAEFMQEGELGFFASTPREFADKVLLIMRDEQLSRKVSANVSKYVVENYDVKENARKFADDMRQAMKVIRKQ
jgi:hypothetical protein